MNNLYSRSESGRLRDSLDPALGYLEGMSRPQPGVLAMLILARARDSRYARCILFVPRWPASLLRNA